MSDILRRTSAFSEPELEVALELIDLGLSADPKGYFFAVAEASGKVVGYACWGDTPLAERVFDLYWIAVDPAIQGGGVGRALLEVAERDVAQRGGRMLLIETGGKPSYDKTRGFYLKTGYAEVARVPDFYQVGDDKVIYSKKILPSHGAERDHHLPP
ncbi:MAG: GNAT family N-acetyltransferase [Myxococcota bacterium]